MKIVVATIGSRGDVQPYINLCQGLQEAGHDVILATNPTLCSLIESHGVKSAPVGSPIDMGEVGARLVEQSCNNMWIGMIRVMQLGARLVEEAYPDVLKLCEKADLVITSDTGSGIAEAEKLGVPWISVTLQPGRIPAPNENPNFVARTLWPVLSKLFVMPTNRFRKRVGSLPVHDITDLMSKKMILLPVSQHVAPREPRWPKYVYPTGYWFARGQQNWSPPKSLLEFLLAGEKPIAVSLGVMGMAGKQSREGARIILQALRKVNTRAIIQGWDTDLQGLDPQETIYHAGSMPHSWLFDQVSAVIHHGGFGTTAAVFRAGVPGIVVPHIIDQFYWGQRVVELGTGPQFISRGTLNASNLSEAMVQAINDRSIRDCAQELGKNIRSEPDGVTEAVRIIEKVFSPGKAPR